ncbi:MAG: FAD-dependent oxidoreductase [Ignavibacteriales bacterium]|nr:FAD-dependent oxidoreductase [Ignavibacteriales bacterium]
MFLHINTLDKRPDSKTPIKNLFLAGDWTNTGLPSTIESAVKSGRIAAELLLNEI